MESRQGRTSLSAPYTSGHEHIADLLARHDWLLRRELARGLARGPTDLLGFAAITEQEAQRLLGDPAGSSQAVSPDLEIIERALLDTQEQIAARVVASLERGVRLPLVELAKRFGLTTPELDLLITCLAVEVARHYERVYGFLHNDMSRRQPSPGLALALHCDTPAERLRARALLNPLAPLRYYRLMEVIEDGASTPWLSRPMRIDERIVAFLLGDEALDARLARYISSSSGPLEAACLAADQRRVRDELLKQLGGAGVERKPLVYFHGPKTAGAQTLARIAAHELGVPILTFDCGLLAEAGPLVEPTLFLMFREALLSQSALFLRDIDRVLDSCHRALLRFVSEMGGIVFASGEKPWSWPMPADPGALNAVELRPAGPQEQIEAWNAVARAHLTDADLHELVSLHPLPLDAIADAWQLARQREKHGGEGARPLIEYVRQACRDRAGTPTNSLARAIEPRHTWSDLVLPTAQREQLGALCNQARHGAIVYGQWGFDRKLSLGRSLNALFSGPPGTGKTLAAEVIARELGITLLKIDLSQIVSKYIGETEKNLRQLFDQAASANAILFFDEADALLGKRSEVKDAHDRYANTETAYLLQKMEEYTGITILSTNLRQNMDDAFTRRMRFIIDFPFPEEDDRLRIWQTVWPSEVPLASDVDLSALARQFRLSGGSIRNVALSAAFLAAEQGQPVSMRHLMRATRGELQKMGRLVMNDDEPRQARRQ